MRKRPGIGAIHKQRVEQERFRGKATELQDNVFEQMTNQMEKFRTNLETFASKHRNEIKKNPAFRKQFQDMCYIHLMLAAGHYMCFYYFLIHS